MIRPSRNRRRMCRAASRSAGATSESSRFALPHQTALANNRIAWYRYREMKFGKIVLGALLAGIGALLLAQTLGYLPAGVWPWLVKFWPYLLLAFGFALLANALKNVVIGVITVALVVVCFAFGAFWITLYSKTTKTEHRTSIDLEKPPVRAVTLQARAVAGSL